MGKWIPQKTGNSHVYRSAEALRKVLDAIESNRVMKLHRSYTRTGGFDGFQRWLVIKQGDREKRVGCSNYFPEGFTRFNQQFYEIVSSYQNGAPWRIVEDGKP
jgi:hypothetical protein